MGAQESKKLNINIDQNSASLSITPAIYVKILRKAVEQTAEDLKKVEAALPVNDFTVIKAVAHKLKGDYDNLRITDLSNIARQMDELAKAEQGNDKILDLLNDFVEYFEQLRTTISTITP